MIANKLTIPLRAIVWTALAICLILSTGASHARSVDSLSTYEARVKENKKDGEAWLRLGQLYYEEDRLDEAQKAYHKAIKRTKAAASYYGLSQVYLRRCQVKHQSIYCIRVEPNLKHAIKRDRAFAPAYLALAEWFRDSGMEDRMVTLLEKYVSLRPEDSDGRYSLALTNNDLFDYDDVLAIAESGREDFPGEERWLPLLAQAHNARGDAEGALALYYEYFRDLPADERAHYLSLSLIARPGELDGFGELATQGQEEFLVEFWRQRDPTLTTGGRSREAEHYRRVWYSRTYFSEDMEPWDRRGEVYIRYGEPDYRSRSGRVNPIPGRAAAAVKERLAYRVYEMGTSAKMDAGVSGMPEYGTWQWLVPRTVGDGELGFGDGTIVWQKPPDVEREIYREPIYPIDRMSDGEARVPWESWIYTKVAGGVEFTFVDIVGSGRWDFPPTPPVYHYPTLVDIAVVHNPGMILQRIADRVPDHFDLPPGVRPLEFYYTTATFRGDGGMTNTEIYFGVPPSPESEDVGGKPVTRVERTASLGTGSRQVLVRDSEELAFVAASGDPGRGSFFPDVAHLPAAPGEYQLVVQAADRSTGRWGVYTQEIEVPDYTQGLGISDIELAYKAGETQADARFRKGEIWVVPMPSRSFGRGQHPSFYYEIYHLAPDDYGRTRYRIDYEIRRHRKRSRTVAGFVGSGVGALFRSRKPSFSVSYDREGSSEWEPIYFELDTEQVKPGANTLTVRVTDLVTGGTVEKEAMFRLDE